MIYKLDSSLDKQRAISFFNKLVCENKIIELKEIKPKRSLNQNRYIHLLFSWFAYETGNSPEDVKQILFKQIVNPSIFYTGEDEVFGIIKSSFRSTKDLKTDEMTLAIDQFRNYSSAEFGIYLPEPNDLIHLYEMEIILKQNGL